MEGCVNLSVIPVGNSSVETHQTDGLAAPRGASSQIQQASSSSGNDRLHANGCVAPNFIMEALSNNIIRIQTSLFFSSSFRRGAIVDLTRGVNHNPRTNLRSRIPCKFFSKKSKYRFEDDYKFSHTNQGPIKQSTPRSPDWFWNRKTFTRAIIST
jgi:hypothetical protein